MTSSLCGPVIPPHNSLTLIDPYVRMTKPDQLCLSGQILGLNHQENELAALLFSEVTLFTGNLFPMDFVLPPAHWAKLSMPGGAHTATS